MHSSVIEKTLPLNAPILPALNDRSMASTRAYVDAVHAYAEAIVEGVANPPDYGADRWKFTTYFEPWILAALTKRAKQDPNFDMKLSAIDEKDAFDWVADNSLHTTVSETLSDYVDYIMTKSVGDAIDAPNRFSNEDFCEGLKQTDTRPLPELLDRVVFDGPCQFHNSVIDFKTDAKISFSSAIIVRPTWRQIAKIAAASIDALNYRKPYFEKLMPIAPLDYQVGDGIMRYNMFCES